MERFWLWIRRNLDTEQILVTVHATDTRHVQILAEIEAIKAAVGDLRENLDMPAMVNIDNIESTRAPAGDPTGL